MELENLNPEEFKSHGVVKKHMPAEVREPTVYTRCPDCGQYTCACANKSEGGA